MVGIVAGYVNRLNGGQTVVIEDVSIDTSITRQIAEEVGCSEATARRSIAQNYAVDLPTEITGKDGKKRKAKAAKQETKPSKADMNAISIWSCSKIQKTADRRCAGCEQIDNSG